jgi:kinesin family protein 11
VRVKKLRESASQDYTVVQQGLVKIQQEAVTANGRLHAFIATADASSAEDSAKLATKISQMEEIIQSWYVNLRFMLILTWAQ